MGNLSYRYRFRRLGMLPAHTGLLALLFLAGERKSQNEGGQSTPELPAIVFYFISLLVTPSPVGEIE